MKITIKNKVNSSLISLEAISILLIARLNFLSCRDLKIFKIRNALRNLKSRKLLRKNGAIARKSIIP